MEQKGHEFIKKEILQNERRIYLGNILAVSIGYLLITLFLNSIRTTAFIWFVWILIILQFGLYFSIFILSYNRAKIVGFKRFSFVFFVLLSVLGRVNDWEIIIIPLMIVVVIYFSFKTKNIPEKYKQIFNRQ